MKPIVYIYLLFFVFTSSSLIAQTEISGTLTDKKGETLPGANVYIEGTYDGGTTDMDGKFSFSTFETGEQELVVSFIGFEEFRMKAVVTEMKGLNLKLRPLANSLKAVTITAGTFEASDEAKAAVMNPLDIVTTAGAQGSIEGAVRTLPGVGATEGDGRLIVRGGTAEETGIYIDGMRLASPYNASIPNIGTRSRFNPFMFKGMAFSTGGYSAEFGQALSSVLDLKSIDFPKENQWDIGIMSVGASASLSRVSERHGFTGAVNYMNLTPYMAVTPNKYEFPQKPEQAKAEVLYRYKLPKNGTLKAYAEWDGMQLKTNQKLASWENETKFGVKSSNFLGQVTVFQPLSAKTSISGGVSGTQVETQNTQNEDTFEEVLTSAQAKVKVKTTFSDRITTLVGAVGNKTKIDQDLINEQGTLNQNTERDLGAAFAEAEFRTSEKTALRPGIRVNQSGVVMPRLSLAQRAGKNGQLIIAGGLYAQDPAKQFLVENSQLNEEKAWHGIVGYHGKFNKRILRVETFYKKYEDLVLRESEKLTNKGYGHAYGSDVMFRDPQTIKNLDYWVSYSFIQTKRKYKQFTEEATPSFAPTHRMSVVGKYWWGAARSQIGFSYTWHSGKPYHDPNQGGFMQSVAPDFHELSLNWAFLWREQTILYASVTNALAREHVFSYRYNPTPNASGGYDRAAITPNSPTFFFVGVFITINKSKSGDQLDTL